MNIFSSLIYGYNVTVIQLLAPIIGISLMSVFIMIYLLLSIKTKKIIYITISVTLSLILIYNIISLIIDILVKTNILPQFQFDVVISNFQFLNV